MVGQLGDQLAALKVLSLADKLVDQLVDYLVDQLDESMVEI